MNQPPGSRLTAALEQPGERALRRSELTDELESRARRLKLLDQIIPIDLVMVMVALVTAVLTDGQLQTGGLVVAGVLGRRRRSRQGTHGNATEVQGVRVTFTTT